MTGERVVQGFRLKQADVWSDRRRYPAVLQRGGFGDVEVIAPRWSQRPVLIGRR